MSDGTCSGGAEDQSGEPVARPLPEGLSRSVSIDLEVSKTTKMIHALAGVRADNGQSYVWRSKASGLTRALAELDDFAGGADFVLGHNFIEHDLQHLRAANPNLRLLQLPVIDTLWLNPLAFPRNPYHRLVKHYQDGQLLNRREPQEPRSARACGRQPRQRQHVGAVRPDPGRRGLEARHVRGGRQRPEHLHLQRVLGGVHSQGLAEDWDWSRCAVLAKEWKYLEPVRSICELENIPVQMANVGLPSVWHLRETQSLLNWLRNRDSRLIRNADLLAWHCRQRPGRWIELLRQALEAHELEAGAAEIPTDAFVEWLAEWGREARKSQRGLLLSTAHRGKGLEFDHVIVLDGGWGHCGPNEDADASRRLYYVAMTRARHTLGLARLKTPNPIQEALRHSPAADWRDAAALPKPGPELARQYRQLSLGDVGPSTPPQSGQRRTPRRTGDRASLQRRLL